MDFLNPIIYKKKLLSLKKPPQKVFHSNNGLQVCGLVFTSLEARLVFCLTHKLELLTPGGI